MSRPAPAASRRANAGPCSRTASSPSTSSCCLLRAGDETSPDYGRLIAPYRFHRLFYLAPKEINGLSPMEWLDRNREAFDADKRLIAERFAPDYLLVNCKTTTEPSAVILLSWTDSIAHFPPANPEGIQYACGTAQAVVREMARQGCPIGFVSVIVRMPDHRSAHMDVDCIRTIGDSWHRRHWSDGEQDFVVLSETREIEGRERILFEMRDKEGPVLAAKSRLSRPVRPVGAACGWYGEPDRRGGLVV